MKLVRRTFRDNTIPDHPLFAEKQVFLPIPFLYRQAQKNKSPTGFNSLTSQECSPGCCFPGAIFPLLIQYIDGKNYKVRRRYRVLSQFPLTAWKYWPTGARCKRRDPRTRFTIRRIAWSVGENTFNLCTPVNQSQ